MAGVSLASSDFLLPAGIRIERQSMRNPVLRGALRKMAWWTTLTYEEDLALEQWEMSRFPGSDFRPLSLDQEGASRASLVSFRTLDLLCRELPVQGTRHDCYEPPKSPALAASLVEDGVILKEELPGLTDGDGSLNHKGVKLLTAALRGLVVSDYELVKNTPGCVMPRLDWSIWHIARLKLLGGAWDLSALIARALEQIQKALSEGYEISDLSSFFAVQPDIPDADRAHRGIRTMAITLANAAVDEALSRFADMARLAVGEPAGSKLHAPEASEAPCTPEEAFATAFLKPLATVGSTWLTDFRPDENPLHEAVQWAHDHTRVHSVGEALCLLGAGGTDPEEKDRMRERMEHLRGLDGWIDLYDAPRLGRDFSYVPERGDTLLLPADEGSAVRAR